MTTQLLEWHGLIFELPLGLGLLYLALYTFSGWTFGDADADASGFDHDVDAHLDVHGEVTLDHELTLDHDADLSQGDLSQDVHVESDSHSVESEGNPSQPSVLLSSLNWVGIGRMPLSLVIMILLLMWGTLGFAAMQFQQGSPVEKAFAVSLAVAAVGSIIITHWISSILSKTLFATLNISRRRHELLGSLGEALYPIDEKFGMACGRDDSGELFQVACRIEQGQPPVDKGAPVQLVAYTAKDRMFYVVPAESSVTPRRAVSQTH